LWFYEEPSPTEEPFFPLRHLFLRAEGFPCGGWALLGAAAAAAVSIYQSRAA